MWRSRSNRSRSGNWIKRNPRDGHRIVPVFAINDATANHAGPMIGHHAVQGPLRAAHVNAGVDRVIIDGRLFDYAILNDTVFRIGIAVRVGPGGPQHKTFQAYVQTSKVDDTDAAVAQVTPRDAN